MRARAAIAIFIEYPNSRVQSANGELQPAEKWPKLFAFGRSRLLGLSGTILAKNCRRLKREVIYIDGIRLAQDTERTTVYQRFMLAQLTLIMIETAFCTLSQSTLRKKQSQKFSAVSEKSACDGSRAPWSQRY